MWVYDQTCRTCTKTSGSQSGKLTRLVSVLLKPESHLKAMEQLYCLPFPVGVKCKEWRPTESGINI